MKFNQSNCFHSHVEHDSIQMFLNVFVLSQETLRTMTSRGNASTVALRRRRYGDETERGTTCVTPVDSTPR